MNSGIEMRSHTPTDHADLMDDVYRGQRHIYDATRKYYLLGRDRLIRELDMAGGGSVLEIGCGTGRNMTVVAQHWPRTKVYGLDISQEMLKSAEKNLFSRGLVGRFKLAQGDATCFDPYDIFGQKHFDCVIFSYSLSMIPDWQGALQRAMAVVSPTGKLCIVDFSAQSQLPGWFRNGLCAWLAKFHVSPRMDLPDFAQKLAQSETRPYAIKRLARDYCQMITIG